MVTVANQKRSKVQTQPSLRQTKVVATIAHDTVVVKLLLAKVS